MNLFLIWIQCKMVEAPTCLATTSGWIYQGWGGKKNPSVTLSITLSTDHSVGFILTAFSPPQSPTPSAYRLIAMQPPAFQAGVTENEARSRDDSSGLSAHDAGGHSRRTRSQNCWLFTGNRLLGKLTVVSGLSCPLACDWCSDRCTYRPLRTAQDLWERDTGVICLPKRSMTENTDSFPRGGCEIHVFLLLFFSPPSHLSPSCSVLRTERPLLSNTLVCYQWNEPWRSALNCDSNFVERNSTFTLRSVSENAVGSLMDLIFTLHTWLKTAEHQHKQDS